MFGHFLNNFTLIACTSIKCTCNYESVVNQNSKEIGLFVYHVDYSDVTNLYVTYSVYMFSWYNSCLANETQKSKHLEEKKDITYFTLKVTGTNVKKHVD